MMPAWLTRLLLIVGTSLVFGGLGGIGLHWWPAWVVAGILYAVVLVLVWMTRPTRRVDR